MLTRSALPDVGDVVEPDDPAYGSGRYVVRDLRGDPPTAECVRLSPRGPSAIHVPARRLTVVRPAG